MDFSPEMAHELEPLPALETFTFAGNVSMLSQLNLLNSSSLRTVTIHAQGLGQFDEFILKAFPFTIHSSCLDDAHGSSPCESSYVQPTLRSIPSQDQ